MDGDPQAVALRPPITLALEQLEAAPPRLLTLREEDAAAVFDVTYRLEADEQGTQFTQISEFEWKKLPKVLHRTFARGVGRDVRATAAKPQARARDAIDEAVNIRIGPWAFDRADYDADGDVLYLHVGNPQSQSEETPEGHVLRFAPGTQGVTPPRFSFASVRG